MNNVIMNSKKYENVTLRPFTYLKPSISSSALAFLIVLVPQLILLACTKSFASLIIIAASVTGSVAADFLYTLIKKQSKYSWLMSIVQGVLIGMLIPSNYPPFSIFLITVGTMFLAKYSFGGFAGSWANPVAVTVAIAYLLNISAFPEYLLSSTDLQTRNASLSLIQNGAVKISAVDSSVTQFLNKTIFKLCKVSIPEGYVSLFWDTKSVIPAFRFNLLTLISSLFLFALDMVDIVIPTIFLFVYGILVRFMCPVLIPGGVYGDIILAFLTSGTLFSTLFLLMWYGTTPLTLTGKILFAFISGIVAFVIIGFGTSPIGFVFSVLIMNIISPIIQVIESHYVRKNIQNILIPKIKLMKEVDNVQ